MAPAPNDDVRAVDITGVPGREPVFEATTEDEREEIWAFRHRVYVDELGRKTGRETDGHVHDSEDDRSSTFHLYTRDGQGAVSGVLRLRSWPPGEIPEHDFEELSLERFPGIEQLATCELSRLMVSQTERGSLLLVALVAATYELAVDRLGAELAFLDCFPALVHLYRRIGAQPYDGRVVHNPDGVSVPLVIIPSDIGGFERAGSFLLPLAERRFGPGGRPRLDLVPFAHLLEAGRGPLALDGDAAWDGLLRSRHDRPRESFLGELGEETLQKLSREGLLLSVTAGTLLIGKGVGQRELFVIVDGLFEVVDNDRRLKLLSDGDIFGEIAFFSTAGRRTASVRAVSDGRVVVLRRRYIDRLRRTDPSAASELLFALARVQADRAATAT